VVSPHLTETSRAEDELFEGVLMPGFIAGLLWTIADTSSKVIEFVVPFLRIQRVRLKDVRRANGFT
jgi:hypothetical protein